MSIDPAASIIRSFYYVPAITLLLLCTIAFEFFGISGIIQIIHNQIPSALEFFSIIIPALLILMVSLITVIPSRLTRRETREATHYAMTAIVLALAAAWILWNDEWGRPKSLSDAAQIFLPAVCTCFYGWWTSSRIFFTKEERRKYVNVFAYIIRSEPDEVGPLDGHHDGYIEPPSKCHDHPI